MITGKQIKDATVTLAKIANIATARLLGRKTAGSGVVEELTQSDVLSFLGTIGIANGGTGQTTADAALNALLPSQTGNSGEYLTTDGTTTSWAAVSVSNVATAIGGSVAVYKSANEAVTSNTTLQSDNDFTFSVGANETWVVFFNLNMSANSAGGLKMDFAVPSGTTGKFKMWGSNLDFSANEQTIGTPAGETNSTATTNVNLVTAKITTSSTPGSVTLQWAQNASSASSTTIYASSYMIATRTA